MFDGANIYHIANTAKFLGDSVAFWDKMQYKIRSIHTILYGCSEGDYNSPNYFFCIRLSP